MPFVLVIHCPQQGIPLHQRTGTPMGQVVARQGATAWVRRASTEDKGEMEVGGALGTRVEEITQTGELERRAVGVCR